MLVHHPKGGTISQPDQECLGGFSVVGVVSVAVLETQFAILETRQWANHLARTNWEFLPEGVF